jgi:hypothetical protein
MLNSKEAFYRVISERLMVFLAFFAGIIALSSCEQHDDSLQYQPPTSDGCSSASAFALFVVVLGLLVPSFWAIYIYCAADKNEEETQ